MPGPIDAPVPPPAERRHWNASVRTGERHLAELMSVLLEAYPTELDGFFHVLEDGTRCPFHVMDERVHGRPRFPVEVESRGTECAVPERGKRSLVEQRAAEGARLHDGRLYRLVEATPERWTLARTSYFAMLESCDYLRYHILREWGEAVERSGARARRRDMPRSESVTEWIERVRAVRTGDFSGYCAAMGLTMPVFSSEGGTLSLLLAKGSASKAAGAGKYHCCPAGMFEFYRNTDTDRLPFEDLRAYLTKELVEETLAGTAFAEEAMQARLDGGEDENGKDPDRRPGDDRYDLRSLERAFDRLSVRWRNEGRVTDLFDAARRLTSATFAPLFVVDAFRLRPEMIVPFYLERTIRVSTNWEVEGAHGDVRRFDSREALSRRLAGEIGEWAEPGLAAALLGGRRWFDGEAGAM